MPRVHAKTKSNRGRTRTCGRCGKTIEPGERYFTWSFRYGGAHFACSAHYPRASELTQSKMGQVYAALENAEDAVALATDLDDVEVAVQGAAEGVREVADEYREAAEAMGAAGAENEEKADSLEGFADELESWEPAFVEDEEGDALESAKDEARERLGEVPL